MLQQQFNNYLFSLGLKGTVDKRSTFYTNFNIHDIFTPVKHQELDILLRETNFDDSKREILVEGFRNGFSLGYQGPENIRITSPNLKFTIGDEFELWDKMMSEVKAKRFAGPFDQPPFEFFVQSPIGLVPKDGG